MGCAISNREWDAPLEAEHPKVYEPHKQSPSIGGKKVVSPRLFLDPVKLMVIPTIYDW
jgi:hypothetical protein